MVGDGESVLNEVITKPLTNYLACIGRFHHSKVHMVRPAEARGRIVIDGDDDPSRLKNA